MLGDPVIPLATQTRSCFSTLLHYISLPSTRSPTSFLLANPSPELNQALSVHILAHGRTQASHSVVTILDLYFAVDSTTNIQAKADLQHLCPPVTTRLYATRH